MYSKVHRHFNSKRGIIPESESGFNCSDSNSLQKSNNPYLVDNFAVFTWSDLSKQGKQKFFCGIFTKVSNISVDSETWTCV